MSATLLETCDEFAPASEGELCRFVQENDSGSRTPLYPVGGRTSLNFGFPATKPGTLVSLARLTQTVDYPDRDMTITVEAGVRMDELSRQLRQAGQQLPIDVAQSNRATLGGVVATNTSGPRRFGLGTMRDYVIGVSAVDACGRLFHAGGRVVKNVAGYDLCKLLVGSMGTLAIITQLTLKLRPIPQSTAVIWTSFHTFGEIDAVLNDLLTSAARPVVLEVLNAEAAQQITAEARQDYPATSPVLIVGVEGVGRETAWQIDTLKSELSRRNPQNIAVAENDEAVRLLQSLTEFQTLSDDPVTFQANLLPSETLPFIDRATSSGVAIQSHAGNGIVIGHLPDEASTIVRAQEILEPLKELARKGRGNLIILNCETEWTSQLPIFGDEEPAWPLMRRLKTALDPHDVLNPGRFIAGENQERSRV
jgi:glycolate oxidase FAD binding subunit